MPALEMTFVYDLGVYTEHSILCLLNKVFRTRKLVALVFSFVE